MACRTVEELAQHRSIVGFRHGQPVAWRIGSEEDEGTFIPNAAYQLNDGDAVIEAAIAGLGICQMPISLVRRHLESGALRSVLDAHMQRHIDIHALPTATCGRRCAMWWMNWRGWRVDCLTERRASVVDDPGGRVFAFLKCFKHLRQKRDQIAPM
jgi:DNA-binding transcriptional LysR family regulator